MSRRYVAWVFELLLLPTWFIQLLYGNGNGTFGSPVEFSGISAISGQSVISADFNRDGAPDLAQSTANQGVPSDGVLINTQ